MSDSMSSVCSLASGGTIVSWWCVVIHTGRLLMEDCMPDIVNIMLHILEVLSQPPKKLIYSRLVMTRQKKSIQ